MTVNSSVSPTGSDDIVAITGLLNLYGFAVDAQQWDLFDQVFTEDIEADFSASAHWYDRQNFKQDFGAFHAQFDSTQHSMMNHQVHIDGDKAYAFTNGSWRLLRQDTEGGPLWDGCGWYDDQLKRTAEGWRIYHRSCRIVWWTGNAAVNEGIPGVKFELETTVLREAVQAGRVAYFNAIQP